MFFTGTLTGWGVATLDPIEDDASTEASEAMAMPEGHVESKDLEEYLGLNRKGYARLDGVKCYAAVVLTSPASIDLYASAGDGVATDPSQTVGVQVDDEQCHALFTDALSHWGE